MKKIDIHLHAALDPVPGTEKFKISTGEEMLAHLEELQIEKAVVMSSGETEGAMASVSGNQKCRELARRFPEKYVWMCNLDENCEQANESSLGGGTYWLSPGWLRYSQTSFIQNREKRFKEYEERFGTDSAAYLIELEGSWLRNYTNACLILWEGWEDERELVRTAKAVAGDAGLGYRELPGDPNFIQALLDGGKDGRFMRIAPGFTPDLDGNGTITAVRVTS